MREKHLETYDFFFPEHSEELHSLLVNCGHQSVDSTTYKWHGLRRGASQFCIWQYTVAGMGALVCNGEKYELTPGKALLVSIPENHCYYLPPESSYWEFYYVSFQGSELCRLWQQLRQIHGSAVCFDAESQPVKEVKKLLRTCREMQIINRYQASALSYRFVMSIFSELNKTISEGNDSAFIRTTKEYILENLHRPIQVDELAENVNYTRSHFSKKFKKEYGKAPHLFILELKMRWALRLLQNSTKSIKEISIACGFNDSSYFAKVFSSYYGQPPQRYREIIRSR